MTDDITILLDRFVNATSSQDKQESLQTLCETTTTNAAVLVEALVQEEDAVTALLQVLHGEDSILIDSVMQLYHKLIVVSAANEAFSPVLLTEALVLALIDVLCLSTNSSYARVTACECLQRLSERHASRLRTLLLQAPNALHRLSELFAADQEEQVRNQALLLAQVLAKWPAVARNWMFENVPTCLLEIVAQEGGLTSGNVVVLDSLRLLYTLSCQDNSALVFESTPTLVSTLTRLVDLRNGRDFLHPKPVVAVSQKKAVMEDDLDELIQGGGTAKTKESMPTTQVIPKLLPAEEDILDTVLDIVVVLLQDSNVRQTVLKSSKPLVSLLWEMALLVPPPPSQAYPCAVPSVKLQQRALQVVAECLNDAAAMERVGGLDRLLYLVCTGGGSSSDEDWEHKVALATSATHVLRTTLDAAVANEMLLHTLAPVDDDDDATGEGRHVTVVQKLVNTILENLQPQTESSTTTNALARKVFLFGATSALSLFLTDEVSRSMLIRIAPTLVDKIYETLEHETDETVSVILLRFVSHWMTRAPVVVQAFLQSPHSTVVWSTLFSSKSIKVSAFTCLILGLAMTFMEGDGSGAGGGASGSNGHDYGGWTVSSLIEMIQRKGVSAYLRKLEQLKTESLPWSACEFEWRIWTKAYDEAVLIVRKRVVQELTVHGAEETEEESAMKKLVAEQTAELESLRQSLKEAESTIEMQGAFESMAMDCLTTSDKFSNTKQSLCLIQKSNSLHGSFESRVHRRSLTRC